MGYYMDNRETDLVIKEENIEKAVKALNELGSTAYHLSWVDENGDILEVDQNVKKGTTPTYNGATPTKASDETYDYTFSGWTPEIKSVTSDVTYKAVFAAKEKNNNDGIKNS